jgi:hypothetical protein
MTQFIEVAEDLDHAGLLWKPEIGDEVCDRQKPGLISILVDPQGLTPSELRSTYLWLPTVEQMVVQVEARQAILFHAGLEMTGASLCYKTVIHSPNGPIESRDDSLRSSVGIALRKLLLSEISPLATN